MEAETEVKTVQVNLVCPDCSITMRSDKNEIHYTHFKFYKQHKYTYTCPRCSSSLKSDIKYPYIKYAK